MRYYEEVEVWKCTKHSSKRRRCNGVCPVCLTLRLSALCPHCANLLPCSCSSSATAASTSSSAASSFHGGSVARISTLIDDVSPYLRRTRSSAFPFFRSSEEGRKSTSSSSRWSILWWRNSRRDKMSLSKSADDAGVVKTPSPATAKGWYFPSPMKVFRHSKASKVAHERSPLDRG
ncbi:hypothetical protein RND81_08G142000 [Saponaria officinalis]|uniref:Uncharacterized protein n=1 Tax=Saponaria officinalis TaxID=3572 RepID=A0AAW1J7I4_SAPOF